MKNLRTFSTGKACRTLIALALILTSCLNAAAFDLGTPADSTPYDRYMSPVRTTFSNLGRQKPTMEQAKMLMLRGRSFHYRMENPYVPAMPEITAAKRSGDCKDKALWLASQLGDADVRFVIGKTEPGARISHAWLMWKSEGRWWLLDCTLKSAPIPADSLPENRYIPLYSYGKDGTYRHAATEVNAARVGRGSNASVAANGQR